MTIVLEPVLQECADAPEQFLDEQLQHYAQISGRQPGLAANNAANGVKKMIDRLVFPDPCCRPCAHCGVHLAPEVQLPGQSGAVYCCNAHREAHEPAARA